MSELRATKWLLSNHPKISQQNIRNDFNSTKAKTIAVASGKGGVGKTSVTLKTAHLLSMMGKKVLLIDCDFNLSNTVVKLGLPIKNELWDYVNHQKTLDEIIIKNGNFHLLPACSGNLDFSDNEESIEKIIIDILTEKESSYDYIFLDCSAGVSKSVLTLSAYCDYRMVVVTPDKSSITDSYSLLKLLNKKYGINENHLVLNKISNQSQYSKLVNTLSSTVDRFLNCRLNILGGISFMFEDSDSFDQHLLNFSDNKIHSQFTKLVKKLTDEVDDTRSFSGSEELYLSIKGNDLKQEVQIQSL
jgi:flagellar biosynthesis protein FlhG